MTERRAQPSIFLERRSYRQRRMMDALRVLPVVGVLLWMLPLFWPTDPGDGGTVDASVAVIYVFSVWAVLILASLALSLVLRQRLIADVASDLHEDRTDEARAGGDAWPR